jgi:SAM-dependent methyltransferase
MSAKKPDPHLLYEAAVQGVDFDLDLMERIYRRLRGRRFRRFREDFCGTAQMAGAWVLRRPQNHAWGVDLHAPTLAWARKHRLARMGARGRRLTLVRADVRSVRRPQVDVIAAYNYSYWVFKERAQLLRYFRGARESLRPGGLFFVTAFCGTRAMGTLTERTRIPLSYGVDGEKLSPYTYVWEQNHFNAITHEIVCYIHFRLGDGRWMRRAFTYDWRMWTVPEICDALREVGFRDTLVYVDGWNERTNQPDDFYRLRKRFANQDSWLAILVGVT